MRGGGAIRPHLMQHHRHATSRGLPGCLGTGEATTDDVNGSDTTHYRQIRRPAAVKQSGPGFSGTGRTHRQRCLYLGDDAGKFQMLETLKSVVSENAAADGFDVEILSVATANPSFVLQQDEAARRAKDLFPHLKLLWKLYDNTGIDRRYNCEPIDWYLKPHSWEERTASFQKHALDLLVDITSRATRAAGIGLDAIDILVTNTITGLAIPSLDARLSNRLKLSPRVERLPIFGLGCGGGVAGLARATRLAHASEGAHVLFLTVDLCSLCLRVNDPSPAMFVSTALFGDGAVGEWFWPDTEHIMGWDIKDDGFGVVLSPELPSLMRKALAPALYDFLNRNGFQLSDFKGFLFHPGGRKLIETMQEVL